MIRMSEEQKFKLYKLTTKDEKILIKAKSRKEAFAKFFKDILKGKIPLRNIGQIVTLHDGEDEYPFRTVPTLYLLGIINKEIAILNISMILECSKIEAENMLESCIAEDNWIIKAVESV